MTSSWLSLGPNHQSWFGDGENRESGGEVAEQTSYDPPQS